MTIERKFEYDKAYMKIAESIGNLSTAQRSKVGAIIVSPNGQIISQGFNGTPSGMNNICETEEKVDMNLCVRCEKEHCDGCSNIKLVTKPEVLHAESNAISKCCRYGGCSNNATVYVNLSPCYDCAKFMIQSGIRRVVFKEEYRIIDGIRLLLEQHIEINAIDYDKNILYKYMIQDGKVVKTPLEVNLVRDVEAKFESENSNALTNLFTTNIKSPEFITYSTLKDIYATPEEKVQYRRINNSFFGNFCL